MIVENLFEETIFPELKNNVESNSIYNPFVAKSNTLVSGRFPIVLVKLLPVMNQYNNLSYGEQTYTFGIDINIYSQDISLNGNKISKRTVCKEIVDIIVNYFESNYHFTIRVELDVPNIDASLHRNTIRLNGRLDTKYGLDNLVIYPR